MNSYILIKIITNNALKVIKILNLKGINLYKIDILPNFLLIKINKKDLKKVKKIYKVIVVKEYGWKYYLNILFNNFWKFVILGIILILIFAAQFLIIDIKVISSNSDLRDLLVNELDKQGIHKYSIAKSEQELKKIKEKILIDNKGVLEWLNIEKRGMNYLINLEPKINALAKDELKVCDIVATKEGTITRIISSKGLEIKEVNETVKKNDVIVSGTIKLNEQEVNKVCAKATVFAKTWYTINIETTDTYIEKKKNHNFRYNLMIFHNNKKKKIFKSRLKNFVDENIKIVNIFGWEFYLQKEFEVSSKVKKYSKKEFMKKVNKLVEEKMAQVTKKENTIIEQKVLKKEEKNSKIYIDMFIVVEEEIGKQVKVE